MNSRKIFIAGILLSLLTISGFASPFIRSPLQSNQPKTASKRGKREKNEIKTPKTNEKREEHFERVSHSKRRKKGEKDVKDSMGFQEFSASSSGESTDWWNLSWSYRQRLNFTGSFSENLTDIPILINLTDNNFNWANANNNGKDIRFTAPNGTELPYEIEEWNYGEEANIWVKVLRINSSATTDGSDYIWMYYGNDEVSGNEEPHKLWKSSYRTVQHLDETSGDHTGSTTNEYYGTPYNVKTDAYGEIDGADYFNTSDSNEDYISFNHSAVDGLNSFTISAWFKTTKTGQQGIISGASESNDNEIIFWFVDDTTFEPHLKQSKETYDISSYGSIADNEWHRLVWIRDVPNNKEYLYIDDSQVVSGTPVSTDTIDIAEGGLIMGQEQSSVGGGFDDPSQATSGTIDEFRVMSTTQNGEEVRTRYRSEADTLLSFGEEETVNIFGTYNVEGTEEGIPNATVSLTNNEEEVVYSGETNTTGNKTFFVERAWYNISISVTEGNYTYENYVTRNYTELPLDQKETNETFSFPLVRLWINVTTGTDDQLGDATIYFSNASNEPQQLQGTSTNEGIFEEFIKVGYWSITVYEDKELFNLYYNGTTTGVKNITGDKTTDFNSGNGISNFTAVNITRGMEWRLVVENRGEYYSSDLNEKIELNTILKWHEELTGNITLKGKDNELIYGNISFSVLDSAGDTVYTVKATNETYLYIAFNTSERITDGVGSYDMVVMADPSSPNPADDNNYNDPTPISKSLDLQEAPTVFSKDIPNRAYYSREITVSSTYETDFDNPALTNQNISDATVTAYFEKGDNQKTYTLPYENGEFSKDINTTDLLGTGTYYVEISTQKENYEAKSGSRLFDLMKIPTETKANESRTNLEVYWSKNTSLTLFYNNTLEETPTKVSGATATYDFSDYDISGDLIETSEGYHFDFNSSRLNISTYTVICSFAKQYHETGSVSLSLQVKKLTTISTLSTQHPTAYWSKNATVKASYQDTVWNEVITDAEATFTIGGASITGELTFNESLSKYLFTINTSRLSIGDFTLTFTLSKENHTEKTHTLTLTVEKLPTDSSASNLKPEVYWSNNVTVNITYTDTTWARNIANANAWYNITDRNELDNLTFYETLNRYIFKYNTSKLDSNTSYTVQFTLNKANRTKQSFTISLTVDPIPTTTAASNLKPQVYFGQTVRVEVNYIDMLHDRTIPNASVKQYNFIDIEATGVLTFNETLNRYIFKYNTSKLDSNTSYTVQFTLNKANRTKQSFTISLTVDPIPTAVFVGQKSYTVPWGDQLNVRLYYNDTLNQQFIHEAITEADVNVTYTINNETNVMYEGWNLTTNATTAWYEFTVNTVAWDLQSYRVTFVFSANTSQYRTVEEVITVTVESLEISGSYSTVTDPVRKNPVTGDTSTEENTFEVTLQDESHGRALTGAVVEYKVVEETSWKKMSPGNYPGAYTTTIDWSTFEVRGEDYNIEIRVSKILVQEQTVEAPSDKLTMTGAIGNPQSVTVDYYGGSTPLFGGIIIPRIWFYGMISVVVLIASYASIRVYTYLTTPPEIRQIHELIEKVQNNVLEYPSLTREDVFNEKVQEHIE